ncbi:DUF3305 domain-containing protein [Limibacillus sp. MBR-115]|jgi:hypothetical protein|uniref:DUF3305 domain-containing protein n=1 Tax=Limibacillus sp. MBR-115 TaxID=3156465 RepID=UPI003392E363
MKQNDERLPLGIVVEKRKVDNPWIDHAWKPVAVVAGAAEQDPRGHWKEMGHGDGWTQYLAGTLQMGLFRKETEAYKVNLSQHPPSVFVVLRRRDDPAMAHEFFPFFVTASPYEAQDFLDAGEDIVERVPMPDSVIAFVETFISEFHVEEEFHKRKRKRYEVDKLGFGKKGPETIN